MRRRPTATPEKRYRCPECGWTGTYSEMEGDYSYDGHEEIWSNHICPGCRCWHHDLEDYEEVEMNNPKLIGSNLVDCIPQTGSCPIGCAECFYNGGRFYRTLEEPLIPTFEEAKGKIVRMNSGHDSNLEREKVIAAAARYPRTFFNTSIPRFDFPGPVVFTCNGKRALLVDCPDNVMFVRIRMSTWDLTEQDWLVEHYLKQNVPVVLTFMRYYSEGAVKVPEDYLWGRSILNDYWKPTLEAKARVLSRYKGTGVRMCGTLVSSLCVDCRNCELLYKEAVEHAQC